DLVTIFLEFSQRLYRTPVAFKCTLIQQTKRSRAFPYITPLEDVVDSLVKVTFNDIDRAIFHRGRVSLQFFKRTDSFFIYFTQPELSQEGRFGFENQLCRPTALISSVLRPGKSIDVRTMFCD